ncbi:MAG: restriction endonuclease subunit S [Candidatus Altimarinota bacterium]
MLSTFLLPYEKLEDRWDIKGYIGKLDSVFPMQKLGKFIKERSIKVKLGDAPNETFSILGVTNKEGVIDTYDELGKNIKQPYKLVETNDITYNPYRVNVGSIGIVKPGLKGKYISPAYVVFYADEKYLLTEYLYLILSSNWFNETLRANTSGSVRQNLTFDLLSSLEIPVPEVSIQEKIVKTYNDIKTEIAELEIENQNIDKEVDNYLMKELGIEIEQKAKKKFFCVRYEDFDFWSVGLNIIGTKNDILNKSITDYFNINPITKIDDNDDVSFVEMSSVTDNGGYIVNSEIIKFSTKKSGYTRFQKGDIIFARITPCTENGKVAVVENIPTFYGTGSTEFYVLRPKQNLNIYFFHQLFLSPWFRKQAVSSMVGSTGRQRVPKVFLESVKIPDLLIGKQNLIFEGINNIKNKSKINGERIEKLKVDLDEKIKGMILDGKDL